jgi:hypothetical protein
MQYLSLFHSIIRNKKQLLTMKKLKKRVCVFNCLYQREHLPMACPVVSSKALDLLHWAKRVVLYQCVAMAIKTVSKYGEFFHFCDLPATLAAAGAIQREYLPDGNVQRLPV